MFPYVTNCSWDKNRATGGKNNKEEKFPYLIVILQAYYWIQTKSLDVVKLRECLFITHIDEGHQVSARQYRDLRGQKREKGNSPKFPHPVPTSLPTSCKSINHSLKISFSITKSFIPQFLAYLAPYTSTLQFFRNIWHFSGQFNTIQ